MESDLWPFVTGSLVAVVAGSVIPYWTARATAKREAAAVREGQRAAALRELLEAHQADMLDMNAPGEPGTSRAVGVRLALARRHLVVLMGAGDADLRELVHTFQIRGTRVPDGALEALGMWVRGEQRAARDYARRALESSESN